MNGIEMNKRRIMSFSRIIQLQFIYYYVIHWMDGAKRKYHYGDHSTISLYHLMRKTSKRVTMYLPVGQIYK